MAKRNGVNLLPDQARLQVNIIRFVRLNKLIMLIVGGIWLGISIIFIALTMWTNSQYSVAKNKLAKAENQLKTQSETVETTISLRTEAKKVGSVLKSRFEYAKAFVSMKNLFPVGVEVVQVDLTQQKSFLVKGNVSKFVDMGTFEDFVYDLNAGKITDFKKININSIALIDNGWKFDAEVFLND